jgi:hypothetical protein
MNGGYLSLIGRMSAGARVYVSGENIEIGTAVAKSSESYQLNPGDAAYFFANDGSEAYDFVDGEIARMDVSVERLPINGAQIGAIQAFTFTGADIRPEPTVTLNGKALIKNVDFSYSYSNNRNAGTAQAIISGKGGYRGTVSAAFTINPAPISGVTLMPIRNRVFDGASVTPIPVLRNGDAQLAKDTDFTVEYRNNEGPGSASVDILGMGNYTGSRTAAFTIVSAGTAPLVSDGAALQNAIDNASGASSLASPYIIYTKGNIALDSALTVPASKYILLTGNIDGTGIYAGASFTGENLIDIGGGLILENIAVDARNKCRAVRVGATGELTVSGGGIVENGSALNGGGIFLSGKFTLNGGEIKANRMIAVGNTPGRGGGVYVAANANANIISGSISGNISTLGAGIYNAGTLAITGGGITGNTASGNQLNSVGGEGGGVCNRGAMTMSGGIIANNTSTEFGGGLSNGGTASLTGGQL